MSAYEQENNEMNEKNNNNDSNYAGNSHEGGESNDRLEGRESDEHFNGGKGDDYLDGGAGLDDASYSGRREEYQLKSTNGVLELNDSVAARDGHDQLVNIERVHFSNANLAFDLDATQSAGKSALIVATCLGNEGLQDKTSIKALMDFFDNQPATDLNTAFQLLTENGIVGNLAGGNDDQHIVEWVGRKVLGDNFTAEIEKTCLDYTHSHGHADFLATVAGMGLNVDLVGLKATGLEFA